MALSWWTYLSTNLGSGLIVTLQVLVAASFTTILWGLVIAALRMSRLRILRFLGVAYIEFFRGTPLIVQILTIFAYLPILGIWFPPFETALITLTLNAGGYMAENYRAGVAAVPHGQIEAARALGMHHLTLLRRVTVPLALRIILPAITNIILAIMLATPFVYLVGLQDMMAQGMLIQLRSGDFTVYLLITLIYLILGLLLSLTTALLERKLKLP
jgi:arginine/lysine/histidine transport system permease protein